MILYDTEADQFIFRTRLSTFSVPSASCWEDDGHSFARVGGSVYEFDEPLPCRAEPEPEPTPAPPPTTPLQQAFVAAVERLTPPTPRKKASPVKKAAKLVPKSGGKAKS